MFRQFRESSKKDGVNFSMNRAALTFHDRKIEKNQGRSGDSRGNLVRAVKFTAFRAEQGGGDRPQKAVGRQIETLCRWPCIRQ
jgi:hypothetical protein